jgi:hypothetical protein
MRFFFTLVIITGLLFLLLIVFPRRMPIISTVIMSSDHLKRVIDAIMKSAAPYGMYDLPISAVITKLVWLGSILSVPKNIGTL